MTELARNQGEPGHERAADPEKVDVHPPAYPAIGNRPPRILTEIQ